MKKSLSSIAVLFLSCALLFAQESEAAGGTEESPVTQESVPALLSGIWQNDDRYVVFNTGYFSSESGRAIATFVLRTFYQWYDDRPAESTEYAADFARDRNDAETEKVEIVELHFTPLTDELFLQSYQQPVTQEDGDALFAETANSGAWDMEIKFAGRKLGGVDSYHIPIAVIGDKLYLNFAIKVEDSDSVPQSSLLNGITIQSENLLEGYWQDVGNANGILIAPPVTSTELLSYYITNDAVYHIRYWRTDMEYDAEAQALFTDGDKTYHVPKHLRVADNVYTCTLGRRTRIRNIDKSAELPQSHVLNTVLVEKHLTDANGVASSYTVRTATICAFGEPYLTLLDGQSLQEIVTTNNARRHPPVKPLFPPHGILDFDWSIIEDPPASYDRRMLDLGK